MISNKEMKELYDLPGKESWKWDETFVKLSNSNDIMALIAHMQTANELYLNEAYICARIKKSTLKEVSVEDAIQILSSLIESNILKNIEVSEDVNSAGESQPVFILTDYMDSIIVFKKMTNHFPFLRQKHYELETLGRNDGCHNGSFLLSCYSFEFPHEVVSGYIYNFSDKSKYIHSWIEFEQDGLFWVADYTMNAILDRDAYYRLHHIDKTPLKRVEGAQLKADAERIFFSKKYKNTPPRKYLLYRDDVMSEVDAETIKPSQKS